MTKKEICHKRTISFSCYLKGFELFSFRIISTLRQIPR